MTRYFPTVLNKNCKVECESERWLLPVLLKGLLPACTARSCSMYCCADSVWWRAQVTRQVPDHRCMQLCHHYIFHAWCSTHLGMNDASKAAWSCHSSVPGLVPV